MSEAFRVLAISGSLRARSSNTEALRAAAKLAPPNIRVSLYDGLATLPPFNPDLDAEGAIAPPPVQELRDQVDAADALLICTPEYAHGVPGVLKNALDWLVSGSEIPRKPIGLINVSPRSTHAQASLAETLRTMSTLLVPDASVTLPLSGQTLDAGAIANHAEFSALLGSAMNALLEPMAAYRRATR